jgi:hypothetical protein
LPNGLWKKEGEFLIKVTIHYCKFVKIVKSKLTKPLRKTLDIYAFDSYLQ